MAQWAERGVGGRRRAAEYRQVRHAVENLLCDIEKRGVAAGREMSGRFDKWDRDA
jgi:sulfopropanediol 3-dehydrogenase